MQIMKTKTLLTNCPNCGAPLSSDGYCSYCNTKVRYANELEYHTLLNHGHITEMLPAEIMFKFIDEDGTMVIIPFIGRPENIELSCDSYDVTDHDGHILSSFHLTPTIKFDFTGCIGELPKMPTISRR